MAADGMREDWNQRAVEDASYYVAFGRRNQSEEEFLASAADVLRAVRTELGRRTPEFWRERSALEIGCGPGRLLVSLHSHFRMTHGLDVSDEMLRLAAKNLRGAPDVRLHHAANSDLSDFADASIDFIYSYAVFQHIPSRDVIFGYLRGGVRVLRPGGLFVFQINGLRDLGHVTSTWNGARVSAEEMVAFAEQQGMLLLALTGRETQYMWVTLQKPLMAPSSLPPVKVQRLFNAYSGETAIPSNGRFGAMSVWIEGLPDDADLLKISGRIDGVEAVATYVSPVIDGLRYVNFVLPRGTRTGLIPVDLFWGGERLVETVWARVIPAGARVPRICSITDGTNLLAEDAIETGSGKLVMEELTEPERVRIRIAGVEVRCDPPFCVDPLHERYEFNFHLFGEMPAGRRRVEVFVGDRALGWREVTVN